MRRIIGLMMTILMVLSIIACRDQSNLNTANSNANESSKINDKNVNETPNQTINVYVVRSYNVIQGAAIYRYDYDNYGYPCACYFHKKCEACGYVSNNNDSTRSNLLTGYHCEKCGNEQRVEIDADCDWIEVSE